MNLLDRVVHFPDGIKNLTDWLGSGGHVVDPKTAQNRANTCLTCAKNRPGGALETAVALAVKAQLGLKNHLKLRVDGEKQLKSCEACGCVLRLLIWEPQDRVERQITDEERPQLPGMCWKIGAK